MSEEEKVYCSMYSRNAELYHHGIKGQKWGVRNGPPYPLGSDVSTGSRLKIKSNNINSGWSKESIKEKDYGDYKYIEKSTSLKNDGTKNMSKKLDDEIDKKDYEAVRPVGDNITKYGIQLAMAKYKNDSKLYNECLNKLKDYSFSLTMKDCTEDNGDWTENYTLFEFILNGDRYSYICPGEADSGYVDEDYILDNKTGEEFIYRKK